MAKLNEHAVDSMNADLSLLSAGMAADLEYSPQQCDHPLANSLISRRL